MKSIVYRLTNWYFGPKVYALMMGFFIGEYVVSHARSCAVAVLIVSFIGWVLNHTKNSWGPQEPPYGS